MAIDYGQLQLKQLEMNKYMSLKADSMVKDQLLELYFQLGHAKTMPEKQDLLSKINVVIGPTDKTFEQLTGQSAPDESSIFNSTNPITTQTNSHSSGGTHNSISSTGYAASGGSLGGLSQSEIEAAANVDDRGKFEVFAYSYGRKKTNPWTKRVKQGVDTFRDLNNMSDLAAAQRIYKDGIDILIDLTGYTKFNRIEIMAHRPAPVQVSYLGFLGSTGAKFIDYMLTDNTVTPKNMAKYFTEKFVYLPGCFQVNSQHKISTKKITRKDENLPDDAVVLMVFNRVIKYDPQLMATWLRIMHRVPSAVMWTLDKNLLAKFNLMRVFYAAGIDPRRLVFAIRQPLPLHLKRSQLADIALDTRLVNGGTTTSEALWSGVPVVTIKGKHFLSRMSTSLLKRVGLDNLIAKDLSEYERLVVDLATNKQALQKAKAKLSREKLSSTLFDTQQWVKNVEKAYLQMWQIYKKGDKPKFIEINN